MAPKYPGINSWEIKDHSWEIVKYFLNLEIPNFSEGKIVVSMSDNGQERPRPRAFKNDSLIVPYLLRFLNCQLFF